MNDKVKILSCFGVIKMTKNVILKLLFIKKNCLHTQDTFTCILNIFARISILLQCAVSKIRGNIAAKIKLNT